MSGNLTKGSEKMINENRHCGEPAKLRITDLKICKVHIPPWGTHLIRIETNQGLVGYGELRDGASPTYVKLLKSRILGENPCEVERLIQKLRPFGGPSRQSAGVSAIEVALWDLAGKAYEVPVYQLLGGRQRNQIRLYADTHIESGRFTGDVMAPEEVGQKLLSYIAEGFSVLKILSVELLMYQKGNISGPTDWLRDFRAIEGQMREVAKLGDKEEVSKLNAKMYDYNNLAHPFTNLHVTEQGLEALDEYIGRIRAVIGSEVPLAIDHFGHFPLADMVKIANRLEKHNLAWAEDMLPWHLTKQYEQLGMKTNIALATGEDIYLAEGFKPLLKTGALAVVHPDLLTIGGILETKKLSTLAARYGASMALHMCESPIASIACAHAATASENFFALEYDAIDMPWWHDIIIGEAKTAFGKGVMMVSDAPGLGITGIDEEVVREYGLNREKDIWVSTDEWNHERSLDRIWS